MWCVLQNMRAYMYEIKQKKFDISCKLYIIIKLTIKKLRNETFFISHLFYFGVFQQPHCYTSVTSQLQEAEGFD